MIGKAYRDALAGKDVDWENIPWTDEVDISIPRLKAKARAERVGE